MKKFMFVNRKAPYGTIYALESLEVVLIAATFDQDCSLVFTDDGVYQLAKGQNTKAIALKNFSPTYRAEVQRAFDEAAECPDFDRPVPAGQPGRDASTR